MDTSGNLQIINSAYTGNVLSLSDSGAMQTPGPVSLTTTNTSDSSPTYTYQVVSASGSSNALYSDSTYNVCMGDPSKTSQDSYVVSGRDIFFAPDGNTQSNKVVTSRISSAGTFYLNCTALPSGVGTGGQMILLSSGDMATFKSTASGNNGISMWQTGTTTNSMLAFQKGSTQSQVGSISVSTTATTYNTSSDARLKEDLGVAAFTSVIDNTVIHDFKWKTDGSLDRGVFAQEAQLVKPTAVTVGSDELTEDGKLAKPWSVDYSKYVPELIVYVQQLNKTIKDLEARLEKAGL
jgi:hypothetical protein